jgi:prepilin-type N-terminal cleavage/methylation domain-containing protein
MSGHKYTTHRGFTRAFTLIELLVVIAIIGILSAVVLASVDTARSKGNNASVEANLSTVSPQAELYYDTNGSYGVTTNTVYGFVSSGCSSAGTIFADPTIHAALTTALANLSAPAEGTDYSCTSNGSSYIVGVRMKSLNARPGAIWCVDSIGNHEAVGGLPLTGVYQCS